MGSWEKICTLLGRKYNLCSSKANYYYYYIRLMAFFSRTTWVSRRQKGKPFWILPQQEMMGVAVA